MQRAKTAHPVRKGAMMDSRMERRVYRPAWMRSDVHVSNRRPMLFVILLIALALVSIYAEGVSEGWWN